MKKGFFRRLGCLFLIVVMSLALAACGSAGSAGTGSVPTLTPKPKSSGNKGVIMESSKPPRDANGNFILETEEGTSGAGAAGAAGQSSQQAGQQQPGFQQPEIAQPTQTPDGQQDSGQQSGRAANTQIVANVPTPQASASPTPAATTQRPDSSNLQSGSSASPTPFPTAAPAATPSPAPVTVPTVTIPTPVPSFVLPTAEVPVQVQPTQAIPGSTPSPAEESPQQTVRPTGGAFRDDEEPVTATDISDIMDIPEASVPVSATDLEEPDAEGGSSVMGQRPSEMGDSAAPAVPEETTAPQPSPSDKPENTSLTSGAGAVTAALAEKGETTGDADEIIADSSAQQVMVVFSAVEDVNHFQLYRMQMKDSAAGGQPVYLMEKLYEQAKLTSSRPLRAGLAFPGDLPSYMISYTDREDRAYYYSVGLSGEDGSVVLSPVS